MVASASNLQRHGTHTATLARQLHQASLQLQQLKQGLQAAQQQLAVTSTRNHQLQETVAALQLAAPCWLHEPDPAKNLAAAMVECLLALGEPGNMQAAAARQQGASTAAAAAAAATAAGTPDFAFKAPLYPSLARQRALAPAVPTGPLEGTAVLVESDAYIRSLQRGLWSAEEARRRGSQSRRIYRLLPSSLPPGAMGPAAPQDLYSYLQLKDAIRNCTACRNCRDKIIRHAKRLDGLDLPSFNPLVLVHGEVVAAIRTQSARVGLPPTGPGCEQPRTLANLGIGSLVRLALQLQAAMEQEPCTDFLLPAGPDAF